MWRSDGMYICPSVLRAFIVRSGWECRCARAVSEGSPGVWCRCDGAHCRSMCDHFILIIFFVYNSERRIRRLGIRLKRHCS
jgi:hypothetical protein